MTMTMTIRSLVHRRRIFAAVMLVWCSGLSACSTYHAGYYYEPRPAMITLDRDLERPNEQARVLATVIGVRRADDEAVLPESIEVRMRIDNATSTTLSYDLSAFTLVAADMTEFSNPILRPPATWTVAPQDSVVFDAYFEFPDDRTRRDVDLSGLTLRWSGRFDQDLVEGSVPFQRLREYYPYHRYHGHYYPRHSFHFGIGYHY